MIEDSDQRAASARGGAIQRLLKVEPGEWPVVVWSFLFGFFVFCSYAVIKPIRDERGIRQGVENLESLFLVGLVAMLVAHLAFAALASRFPRRSVAPVLYRFIAVVLLVFAGAFSIANPTQEVWLARAFYVWVSVYNLFATSVYFVLMADTFQSGPARRLFPILTATVTIGGMAGSVLTALLVERIGVFPLLVVAAVLLELGVRCVVRLRRVSTALEVEARHDGDQRQPILSGAFEGLRRIARSPYLIGICLFLFLYAYTSSVLYFERQNIVAVEVPDRRDQVALFAHVELVVQWLALLGQLFVAGRLIDRFGVTFGLVLVPVITVIGFATLGATFTLEAIIVFEVLRKATNYSVTRPAREILFTVVDRAEKYKAKSFIDTFVYRGGDSLAAVAFATLKEPLALPMVALTAVPFALAWAWTGFLLGRRQGRMARSSAGPRVFESPGRFDSK